MKPKGKTKAKRKKKDKSVTDKNTIELIEVISSYHSGKRRKFHVFQFTEFRYINISIDRSLPLYLSVYLYVIVCVCVCHIQDFLLVPKADLMYMANSGDGISRHSSVDRLFSISFYYFAFQPMSFYTFFLQTTFIFIHWNLEFL